MWLGIDELIRGLLRLSIVFSFFEWGVCRGLGFVIILGGGLRSREVVTRYRWCVFMRSCVF